MEEILKIEDQISAGFAAGDASAVAAQYTEDAIFMPPFRPPIHGRNAIEAFYREGLSKISIQVATEVEELEVMGDWAYLRGTFRQTLKPKGSKAKGTETTGKYLVIARRCEDGHWRFARDIFNGNQPPALMGGCLGLLLAPIRKLFGG